ncbi:hypothetical protein ACILDT_07170 [Capnocytophaga canis]|uniref:hypothetical protein n=1 Tax=Capnocytophaga TaxID=1016 RepID=UPI0012FF686A|nr:hypothetical protein [Capnocytophaga sp. H2931]
MKDNKKIVCLSKEELKQIEGGGKIKDTVRDISNWLGEKMGEVSYFLSNLDWSGNFLGY